MSLQVVNLAHLAYLIRSSTERFIKLELEWDKVGQLHYSSQFASGLASKSRTLFWACRLYKSGRWDLLLLCRFLAGLQPALSVVAGVGCSLFSCDASVTTCERGHAYDPQTILTYANVDGGWGLCCRPFAAGGVH
jgi:hypothetical protein